MSDGRKKIICPKETGTVPKVKYWKNTAPQHETHVANNLISSMLPNQERTHIDSRNRQRCSNYHCFEGVCMDDTRVFPNYNSLPYLNMSGGTTSPSTSGSTSRRHSGGGGAIRKCDNITKYPDKKQIEEKLNQIREYLKVTSSLMSSVKEDQSTSDEADDLFQMFTALSDSEKKLEALLANQHRENGETENVHENGEINEMSENGVPTQDSEPMFPTYQNKIAERNELEQKMEMSEKKLQELHDQQTLLMRLQEKAENQLKDARKAQERLAACANSIHYSQTQTPNGSIPEQKNPDKNKCVKMSQLAEIDARADQMGLFNTTNESRNQMLRLLDARDSELCTEQQALQQKLHELNSKKQQIDQLVSQLHNYGVGGDTGSEDGDDMANQIRQIVAMKEQLAMLKDMLSAVKSSEAAVLQQQNSVDRSEASEQVTVKSGNVAKSSSLTLSEADCRLESERRWRTMGKQSNKSSISSSREQLQAELQAKRQELEELMYKDQDRTSAINQDVCNELVMNKGEHPFSLDSVPSSWTLLQDNTPPRGSCMSRENVYSSDEDELENYSQMNNTDSNKPSDYVHCNFGKQMPTRPVLNCNPTVQEPISSPSVSQNFNQQWSGVDHKQVELMTSLCQSLLEQQRQVMPTQCSVPNFQWYTSYMQMQQALMLSTISQCCQLLWQQQQDINTLINTVSVMQQRTKPQTLKVSQTPSETVASACSLPTRLPSNNTEYAALSRETLPATNASRIENSGVGVGGGGAHPPPLWTGAQALNNQVAPGNRANNYWDNFRSYSRQNLLSTSTKSNEGSQNSLPIFERSNASGSFCQPMGSLRSQQPTLPKINMPIHEGVSSMELNNQESLSDLDQSINRSERTKSTKRNKAPCRNRNEWNENAPQSENSPQKSKLFEVLRENVYKEVTLLISANENRPHFLIQLFRDLQLISSDPLRRSALQSIQALITHSLADIPASTSSQAAQFNTEERLPTPQYSATTSTPSRNKTEKQSTTRYGYLANATEPIGTCKLDSEAQRILIELLPFLKSHNEDVFHNGFMDMIKLMIFHLLPAKHSASNNKLQAKLDALLTASLSKYNGRRIVDIKEELLKTIADILLEELPVTTLVKDRQSTNSDNHSKPVENMPNSLMFLAAASRNSFPFEAFQFLQLDQKGNPNLMNIPPVARVDNGDLAEADQSTRETEDTEEGAVGGLQPPEATPHNHCEVGPIPDVNELQTDLEMFINPQMNH